ncbi:ribosomal protein S5 domain 2-type protein [Fimicolochytrium jonesii]|uniref:ribosomal protein S5 domain 2-type protein n=1 Tax=Fimicolochytrium jonesii TaxID=1396493 RepID=UPI0022FF0882|nr:ribosomal protein S5 domain 2-type protein [Fimicolochytrium jonesii]KAI8816600.1 ribosomal protein S5 domain 2-type protein [Fimicolochytrium jonesii]
MADRKRVQGPEKSVVPLLANAETAVVFDPERRKDGRNGDRIRPVFMKTGIGKQANGSAYLEAGKLKVACGVYGPRQTSKSKVSTQGALNCDFKFSPFALGKRKGFMKDAQEREYSLILDQALSPAVRLDLLPKSSIDIFVQVLESDGSAACLAAAITCASLALADAGIEMLDAVAACAAAYVDTTVLLDPTDAEEPHTAGSLVLSYMPSLNEVTHVIQSGETTTANTVRALEVCVDACSQIHGVMMGTLVKGV